MDIPLALSDPCPVSMLLYIISSSATLDFVPIVSCQSLGITSTVSMQVWSRLQTIYYNMHYTVVQYNTITCQITFYADASNTTVTSNCSLLNSIFLFHILRDTIPYHAVTGTVPCNSIHYRCIPCNITQYDDNASAMGLL